MQLPDFKDKRILILGFGLNQGGLGVSKWLLRHGARLTITDLKDAHALAPSIEALAHAHAAAKRAGLRVHRPVYVLGRHRDQDVRHADLVVRNPGVPRESRYLALAKRLRIPVESDVSLFMRRCPHPIVGVTGTKGKTTVTSMLGAMLEAGFGRAIVAGNIRTSPLDSLDALVASKRPLPVALELSSWQLESLEPARLSPAISVLTNILPDHLNRYEGMDDYAAAKELIFAWQLPTDAAIVPYDDRRSRAIGGRVRGERVWASMHDVPEGQNALFVRRGTALLRWQGVEVALFRASDLRVPGDHNLWNALLAAGAAWLRGVAPKDIVRALRAFKGVPHRLERVRSVAGVAYWNDTAATTPEASSAAMATLFAKRKGVLIAGGADKELVFGAWAKDAARRAKEVVLFEGSATPKMLRALKKAGANVGDVVGSMPEAVRHASLAARRGEAVLLSPGCASFGVFVNEFDRGDKFRAAVKKLR